MKTFITIFIALPILLSSFALAQWGPDVRLTQNVGQSHTSFNNARCIAAVGDNIHVVWYDNRQGSNRIFYKRSVDAGATWSDDIALSSGSATSEYPAIAAWDQSVHVVWEDNRDGDVEIYYKRSLDGGLNWGPDIRLTYNASYSGHLSIAALASQVHVVWMDTRHYYYEIYYLRSLDNGESWGTETRLTNDVFYSDYPSVAAWDSLVHVVWYDGRDNQGNANDEIYYKRSSDSGATWSQDIRLTNDVAGSTYPSIAASGAGVHVVWMDTRSGNYEIYYKHSLDAGLSWNDDQRLTDNVTWSEFPSVAASGSMVHVVWTDQGDGNREIFYLSSIDGGTSWSAETRLTYAFGESEYSSVVASGSAVHVAWEDNRDGNREIYYKRNPTGNLGVASITTGILNRPLKGWNYPNPFRGKTNIRFSLSAPAHFRLEVYNALGQQVASLISQEMAAGLHERKWEAGNMPGGIYLYRLQAGNREETGKMILLR